MKKPSTSIMRHILEVRLRNRMFKFLDFRGNLVDFLIKETGFDKVRITDKRIDVASDDLSEVVFFSWENFGFQLDGVDSFEAFEHKVSRIFSTVGRFEDYNFDYVSRVGTKSSILTHLKGRGLGSIRQKYDASFFKNSKELELGLGFALTDTGYFVHDLERDGSRLNLLTGPATKGEAIVKFFDGKPQYEKFSKGSGLFVDIDLFRFRDERVASLKTLQERVKENVLSIEKVFEGLLNYIVKA